MSNFHSNQGPTNSLSKIPPKRAWIQIRLSKEEYKKLKDVRSSSERGSERRISIRQLYRNLLNEALEKLNRKQLVLPGARRKELCHADVAEYYAWPASAEEAMGFDRIIAELNLPYNRADVMRYLIEQKHEEFANPARQKFTPPNAEATLGTETLHSHRKDLHGLTLPMAFQ